MHARHFRDARRLRHVQDDEVDDAQDHPDDDAAHGQRRRVGERGDERPPERVPADGEQPAGYERSDAEQRNHYVQQRIELGPAAAQEVTDAGDVDDDVDRHEHDDQRAADDAERVGRVVLRAERERDRERQCTGDDDRDVGRSVSQAHSREPVRQRADPAQRVAGAAGDVHTRVRVRDRGVDDGQEDQDPEDAVQRARQALPRVGARRGEVGELRGPVRDVHRVGRDDVEQADQQRRADDRAPDRAARVAGLLRERRRTLEAAEAEQREHRSADDAGRRRGSRPACTSC